MPSLRLSTLVSRLGGAVRGDAEAEVREVASLANAGEGQLAFFDRSLSVRCLSDSRAEVIILRAEDAAQTRQTCWLVDGNPRLIFARAAKIIRPPEDFLPVVSPQACVDKRATLGKRVGVGAGAVVGEGAVLGDDCRVHAGVVVGAGVQVGRGTELFAHVVLYPGVTVGDRCTIHAGAVVGADGFGFVADEEGGRQKIPQLGGVRLGDDVEVGANTTIDRGTLDDTVIGSGVKVDNQVQIGHNVRIGREFGGVRLRRDRRQYRHRARLCHRRWGRCRWPSSYRGWRASRRFFRRQPTCEGRGAFVFNDSGFAAEALAADCRAFAEAALAFLGRPLA